LPIDRAGRLGAAWNVAKSVGAQMIAVRTNCWWLVNDGYFFDEVWHGALLSAMAWFFSGNFNRAFIASSYDPAYLHPWGSHPLLDPCYSGAHMTIDHHGLWMSRLDKTALIAEWPVALENLRVCQGDSAGMGNCGTCEKCIRTMTALAALGKLEDCAAFPERTMTPELLRTVEVYDMFQSPYTSHWYRELLPLLAARGRLDLVSAVEDLMVYDARKKW